MAKGRIPVKLGEFNTHFGNIINYLNKVEPTAIQTRGEILGMTQAELIKLNVIYSKWTSNNPGNPGVWDLHSHPNTKSKLTRKNILQVMKEFAVFFRPLLLRISASTNITSSDRSALRIAPPVSSRKRPTLAISENCFASTKTLGSSRVRIKCHTLNDGGRPSKPQRADAVEIAYRLDLHYIDAATGEIVEPKRLIDYKDGTTKLISTKASFMLDFGSEYQGYRLQFFARWINIRHPNLNGPWNGPYGTFIG